MNDTALITGGTGGLGTAVVAAFVADGWRVVGPVRPGGARELRPGVEAVEADLLDAVDVQRVVGIAAGEPARPLRALVNLVGGYAGGTPLEDLSLKDFDAQLTLNLHPTFLAVSTALPHLRAAAPAAIVCVSSRAAVKPFAGAAGYITAKAAVIAFARAVAAETTVDGVRCNVVLPSVIDTPANRAAQPGADRSAWVAPERIADVIRFLCSSESQPMSGAALPVYGSG